MPPLTVALPDGRVLEALCNGPADGRLLLFQTGTPTAALEYPPLAEIAARRGLRTVVYPRPGYAGSTPRPGRSVADVVYDIFALLDRLRTETFVTVGWSGGGPHALACAALLPDRCLAAATLAGVAPYAADGLNWLEGMGPENVEEFSLASQGEAALTPWLERESSNLACVTGADVSAALGGLVSEIDREALTGDFADYLASCFRGAVSTGFAGWRDDDLAFVREWGFELGRIKRPVAVWQGSEDRTVPFAHGQWLAERIPRARAHLDPHEGHLSLAVAALDQIIESWFSSRARNSALLLVVEDVHVEWAVEQDHEHTRPIRRGLVLHHRLRGEVRIGPRPDDVTVGFEPSFDNYDRVCGGVAVQPTLDAGRIADEIVLLSRFWVHI